MMYPQPHREIYGKLLYHPTVYFRNGSSFRCTLGWFCWQHSLQGRSTPSHTHCVKSVLLPWPKKPASSDSMERESLCHIMICAILLCFLHATISQSRYGVDCHFYSLTRTLSISFPPFISMLLINDDYDDDDGDGEEDIN
jgi:hypothetical protein